MEEFRKLSIENQVRHIRDNGKYLAIREHRDFLIDLYHIDGFYVEVWFHPNIAGVNQVRCFDNPDHLSPYLDDLDIAPLYAMLRV